MVTEYTNCISYTTQFPYCPLAFRLDSYRGCEHDCKFCFSNILVGKLAGHCKSDYGNFAVPADNNTVIKKFRLAGHESEELDDMEIQSLKRRLPLHFGGLSDPFQPIEKIHRVTLSMLQILSNYNYPTILSTKGTLLTDSKYLNQFDNIPIVLQVSISTMDEKIAKVIEPNAPTPKERLNVVKTLSDMGYYVTVRNEPYYPGLPFKTYEDYFTQVAEAGAKHVSFAAIRVYSKQHEYFEQALGTEWLKEYLGKAVGYMGYKRLRNEYIIDYSKKFIDIIHNLGMTAGGGADVDSLLGDSYCCCAPLEKIKGFENLSKYNMYYAARIAKEKGQVTYSDIEKEWHPKGEMWKKTQDSRCKTSPQWATVEAYMLHQWNRNKSSGMVVDNIEGIYHDGLDNERNAIFKYGKKPEIGGLFE